MERTSFIVPFLSIVVAAVLAAFAVAALFFPVLVGFLPWAGLLAGLLALLQSMNLRNAAPAVRWALALAGFAAAVFMLAVLAFR